MSFEGHNLRNPLPVQTVLPELVSALRRHRRVVLHAPPGTGKSTTVPSALAESFTGGDIRVAQPRRLAARELARYVASVERTELGTRVGYEVRFDRKAGCKTRIRYVTNGLLLRQILHDPFLEQTQVVVLDEFHERSIDSDLLVSMVNELADLRDDFYVVVMSATLETEALSEFLGAPVVSVQAPLFPLTVEHQKSASTVATLQGDVQAALRRAVRDTDGDILVFLPGVREIRDAADAARSWSDLDTRILHGSLSLEEQSNALGPSERRRAIFSTNIAETSLTVSDVRVVIDCGLEKINVFDPATGFNRLTTQRISQASATQRAGRSARQGPGTVFRLWTTAEDHRLRTFRPPEVARTDVCSHVLKSATWSENVNTFRWYERPPSRAFETAVNQLRRLEAIAENGAVTDHGRELSNYPLHPILAALVDRAKDLELLEEASLIAAVLSEPDTFDAPKHPVDCDVTFRAKRLSRLGRSPAFRVAQQIAGRSPRWSANDNSVRKLMFEVFFHLGAVRRGARYSRFAGGSVVLGASKVDAEFVLALRTHGTRRVDDVTCGVVQYACKIDEDWIESRVERRVSVRFDEANERVSVFEERTLGDLVLSSQRAAKAEHSAEIHQVMLDAVTAFPARAFSFSKEDHQFLARYERAVGEPLIENRTLLGGFVSGCETFQQTRKLSIAKAANGLLPYDVRQLMDAKFPAKVRVPSGRNYTIDYLSDPPVLAVRIQELFGWESVPNLGFKVMLHLLAPNYRPAQVTDDLASFWTNTYPEVRKELRARYPKHAWPEDPRSVSPNEKR